MYFMYFMYFNYNNSDHERWSNKCTINQVLSLCDKYSWVPMIALSGMLPFKQV